MAVTRGSTILRHTDVVDRVAGAAHFAVSDQRARDLVAALQARVPGYLVPRLVREEPGAPGKTPLS